MHLRAITTYEGRGINQAGIAINAHAEIGDRSYRYSYQDKRMAEPIGVKAKIDRL